MDLNLQALTHGLCTGIIWKLLKTLLPESQLLDGPLDFYLGLHLFHLQQLSLALEDFDEHASVFSKPRPDVLKRRRRNFVFVPREKPERLVTRTAVAVPRVHGGGKCENAGDTLPRLRQRATGN